MKKQLAVGSGHSLVVKRCQICSSDKLKSLLFIGYLPPVNEMKTMGERPHEDASYPAELLFCPKCHLVQLGLIVDPEVLFPPTYPYTSGTTRILRENFADLAIDAKSVINLNSKSLVVDIGSNDGTLLSNFSSRNRVVGVEPSDRGLLAVERGIPTYIEFFGKKVVDQILKKHGPASLITATNVFAHIEDIHDIVRNIKRLLKKDGVFVSESHYLGSVVGGLQYDTIYHEHLRYYSLDSLNYLLKMHGFEIVRVKMIPTHGGSIRVYAARKGMIKKDSSVQLLKKERKSTLDYLRKFNKRVAQSKLDLLNLIRGIKKNNERIVGIGAPSRASTLVNYVGLDDALLDYVCETKGSYKIGKYMPGTLIPVIAEDELYRDQPDYALLLSWHIAEELMPKIKEKGFRGDFIIPLPIPRIVKNRSV